MEGKLEKRRALWEEKVAEEVTNFTLHREAGREIRSHMADQDLKLERKNCFQTTQYSQNSISLSTHKNITFTFTFHRGCRNKVRLPAPQNLYFHIFGEKNIDCNIW